MTPFTLSAAVQAAINTAVNTDPGANNVNYLAAYNAIYNDLVAQNARGNIIAPEVLAWFQQAPLVNGEQWKPTAQGTFIWDYTVAAAFAEGATITNPDLHKASDAIAFNVFSTLKNDKFSFNSNPDGDFSMTKIIAKDAGAGVQVLKDLHPSAGLDNAIWGGTLFARTEFKSPSYFADYHITLGIGSRDSKAVLAGLFAGSDGAFFYSNQTAITSISNIFNLDWAAIFAAALPSNSSLILPSWLSKPTWVLGGNIAAPNAAGSNVANGNVVIYDASTRDAFTLIGSTTSGHHATVIANSQTGIHETIVAGADGSVSYLDETGKQFASYQAGTLTGGTIKVNGNEIDAYNSAGSLLNSTAAVSIGGKTDILDKTYTPMQGYQVTNIDMPANALGAGLQPVFTGVNDSGEVVGFAQYIDGYNGNNINIWPGFTYKGNVVTPLIPKAVDNPIFSTLGSPPSLYPALGINNSGQVVGDYSSYFNNSPIDIGYEYDGVKFTPIIDHKEYGTNERTTSLGAISNNGIIAGNYNYFSAYGGETEFIYKNGTFTDLPSATNAYVAVSGVNNDGTVIEYSAVSWTSWVNGVGSSEYSGQTSYVLNNGKFNPIIIPGAALVTATGINDSGLIVGYYASAVYVNVGTPNFTAYNGDVRGFTDNNGVITTVDVPDAVLASGLKDTFITGVADNGTIVGHYRDASGTFHNFTATPAGNVVVAADTTNLYSLTGGTTDLQVADLSDVALLVAQAGQTGFNAHLALSDTSANVVAKATVVAPLIADGAIGSISFTEQNPSLTFTDPQAITLAPLLGKVTSAFNETILADTNTSEAITGTPKANNTASFANLSSGVTASLLTGIATQQQVITTTTTTTITPPPVLALTGVLGPFGNPHPITTTSTTTYTDHLSNIRNLIGSSHADTLIAGASGQTLTGNGGTDTYVGFAGGGTTFSDTAANLSGTAIQQFVSGDSIFIKDLDPRTARISFTEDKSGTFGTLSVSDGTHSSIIALSGQYQSSRFYGYANGLGGTSIRYLAPTDPQLTVSHSAAEIPANFLLLQQMLDKGLLHAVHLTDVSKPTLGVTSSDESQYGKVLNLITDPYNMSVSGVTAATAATTAILPHVISIAVSDSPANIVANIAALQTVAVSGKLSSINQTGTGPQNLSLTVAQITANAAALSKITGGYNVTAQGATMTNLASLAANPHVTSIVFSDSAANIQAGFSSLEGLLQSGKLGFIQPTDKTIPSFALTGSQYASAEGVLEKIGVPFHLALSGVTSAVATAIAAHLPNLKSVTISDTLVNVVAQQAALHTLQAATKLGTIDVTGAGLATVPAHVTGPIIIDNATINAHGIPLAVTGSGDTINGAAGDSLTVTGIGKATGGDTVNLSHGKVAVDPSTLIWINGTTDIVTAAANDDIGLYGTGNTLTAGTNSGIWVAVGGGNTINAVTGDYVNVSGSNKANGADTVNMSGGTIVVNAGAQAVVNGSTDQVTLANNAGLTINGNNEHITGGTGDTFQLNGTGDSLTASNGTVALGLKSQLAVTGNTMTFMMGGQSSVSVSGGNNTFTGMAKDLTGSTIGNFISGDFVHAKDLIPNSSLLVKFQEAQNGTFGTLTTSDGTHASSIILAGQHTAAGFFAHGDGASGTSIGYMNPTDPGFGAFHAAHTDYKFA